MKRIKADCLLQTLHFQLKLDLPREEAVQCVKSEVARYKAQLERSHTLCRIDEEIAQADGSVILKIRKQYNYHDCGSEVE